MDYTFYYITVYILTLFQIRNAILCRGHNKKVCKSIELIVKDMACVIFRKNHSKNMPAQHTVILLLERGNILKVHV